MNTTDHFQPPTKTRINTPMTPLRTRLLAVLQALTLVVTALLAAIRARRTVTSAVALCLVTLTILPTTAAVAADTPVLSIKKTTSAQTVKPGDTFTYTVTVGCSSNTGLCEGTTSTDELPSPLTLVDVIAPTGDTQVTKDGNKTTITFTQTDEAGKVGLRDGTSVAYQVIAKVPSDLTFADWNGKNITNTATAEAQGATRVSSDAPVQIKVNPPTLEITAAKSGSPTLLAVGETTTVTLTGGISSSSANTASSLTVTDIDGAWWDKFTFTAPVSVAAPAGTEAKVTYTYADGSTSTADIAGTTLPAPEAGKTVRSVSVTATKTDGTGIAAGQTLVVKFTATAIAATTNSIDTVKVTAIPFYYDGTPTPVTKNATGRFSAESPGVTYTGLKSISELIVPGSTPTLTVIGTAKGVGGAPTGMVITDDNAGYFSTIPAASFTLVRDYAADVTYLVEGKSSSGTWSTIGTVTGPGASVTYNSLGAYNRGVRVTVTPNSGNTDRTWDVTIIVVGAPAGAPTAMVALNSATICPPGVGVGSSSCTTVSAPWQVTQPQRGPGFTLSQTKTVSPGTITNGSLAPVQYSMRSGIQQTAAVPSESQWRWTITDNTGSIWTYYRLKSIDSITLNSGLSGLTSTFQLSTFNGSVPVLVGSYSNNASNITNLTGVDGVQIVVDGYSPWFLDGTATVNMTLEPRAGITQIPAGTTSLGNTVSNRLQGTPMFGMPVRGDAIASATVNVTGATIPDPPHPAATLKKAVTVAGAAKVGTVPLVAPGSHADWTLTLKSTGTGPLTGATIVDTIPGVNGQPALTPAGEVTATVDGVAFPVTAVWSDPAADGSRIVTITQGADPLPVGKSAIITIPTTTIATWAGTITNRASGSFPDGDSNVTIPESSAAVQNAGTLSVDSFKWVREVPAADAALTGVIDTVTGTTDPATDGTFYRYPQLVRTLPGGTAEWKTETVNTGTTALGDLVTADVMPTVGNGGIIAGGNLDTTWAPKLTGPVVVTGPGTHTVRYLIGDTACTAQQGVVGDVTDACDWQAVDEATIDWSTVTGFRVDSDFGTTGLKLGEKIVATVQTVNPKRLPDGTASEIENAASWNTFASGRKVTSGWFDDLLTSSFLAEQPRKAGITMANPADGTFTITKQVTSPDGISAPAGQQFTVDYTYDDGAGFSGSGSLVVTDGQTVTGPALRPGTVVKLSEAAPTAVPGATWGAPIFSKDEFTIGEGETVAVTLTNELSLAPTAPVIPLTGGTGTALLIVGGLGVLGAFAATFLARRKRD